MHKSQHKMHKSQHNLTVQVNLMITQAKSHPAQIQVKTSEVAEPKCGFASVQ